jgi:hypothetical protein
MLKASEHLQELNISGDSDGVKARDTQFASRKPSRYNFTFNQQCMETTRASVMSLMRNWKTRQSADRLTTKMTNDCIGCVINLMADFLYRENDRACRTDSAELWLRAE